MKKKYHHHDVCTYVQPSSQRLLYAAPNIWTTPFFMQDTILGDSGLRTTITNDNATVNGRSNEMNFDEDELSAPPSLWND